MKKIIKFQNKKKKKIHRKNQRNKAYPYQHFEQLARECGISAQIDKHGVAACGVLGVVMVGMAFGRR
jgi:hypothetical protein